jgi:hypothetical protein
MFGAGAGDVMAAVQMAMLGGLPYTAIRDAITTHPTMPEGLKSLFSNVPPISAHAANATIAWPAAAKDEPVAHAQSM